MEISLKELEEMLTEQKRVTADYITRNLSCYNFSRDAVNLNIDLNKEQLRGECLKSGFPSDFNVLKKYLKQSH